MKRIGLGIIVFITLIFIGAPLIVFGEPAMTPIQNTLNDIRFAPSELGTEGVDRFGLFNNIEEPLGGALSGALALVGTLFFLLTVYAGMLWLTAAGNEEQVGKARKILITSIVGLAVVMAAAAITAFVSANAG